MTYQDCQANFILYIVNIAVIPFLDTFQNSFYNFFSAQNLKQLDLYAPLTHLRVP